MKKQLTFVPESEYSCRDRSSVPVCPPEKVEENVIDKYRMTNVRESLKSRFFGIDNEIDDICEMVEPWSKVPECYIRPLIINLWGPTGIGKTSLVRMLAKEMNIPLIEIDLGAFTSNSDSREFSKKFWEDYWEMNKKPCIILIDEVHIARTIDEGGAEVDRNNIRGFWSLLSDGKIVINERMEECQDVDWLFDEAIAEYNKYRKQMEVLKPKKDKDSKDEYSRILKDHIRWSFASWTLKVFCKLLGISYREMQHKLDVNFMEAIEELRTLAKGIDFQPILDFSKSLIFVSGNLDDAYMKVHDFDPDVDLDIIYEHSMTINFAEVKHELSRRFRPEQIGRFGNNHIIYPSLNKDSYIKIIQSDVLRIKNFFSTLNNNGFDFEFDYSIVDLMYREGVVPAQGARSVLSTITSILESNVIAFTAQYCCDNGIPDSQRSTKVKVHFNFEEKKIYFNVNDGYCFAKGVKMKVDDLRRPKFSNQSIACSVHEAGHVLASILFQKIIPSRATAYSLGSYQLGVVESDIMDDKFVQGSADEILNCMRVAMGSIVSMEVVFGNRTHVGGISSDIRDMTEYAVILVNEFGIKRNRFGFTKNSPDTTSDKYIMRKEDFDIQVENLIQENYDKIKEAFESHRIFLLDLSSALVSHSYLGKEEIRALASKHNVSLEDPYDYTKKFLDIYEKDIQESISDLPFFKEISDD